MNIQKLKEMMSKPASKEWFAKYGSPKQKALKKVNLKKPRLLTEAESKEKTKNWPKSPLKEENHTTYQKRVGRGYNE